MLTAKENLLETIKPGGKPERFVKQFEFMELLSEAAFFMGDCPDVPGTEGYDRFGVLWRFPLNQMGSFPIHDSEHLVLPDITVWRDVIQKPAFPGDPEFLHKLRMHADSVDRKEKYVAAEYPQGIFERLHALMGMENTLANFYEEPEEMHALIDFLVGFELEFARFMVEHVGIDAIFHHDDWGSAHNSFLSPTMFDEFLTPAYQKIYGYYKEQGCLVIHHDDAYSANLVPSMIAMGIDIWQGPTPANDIPALIEKYGDRIIFMGEVESKVCDLPDWTPEIVAKEVERACIKCGTKSFIPCLTAGNDFSTFPGVDKCVDENIDRMSRELFGEHNENRGARNHVE